MHLRVHLRSRHFDAFVTYGNVSSNDYLGVILESFGFFTKSVLNGGSGGPLNVLSLDARREMQKCTKWTFEDVPQARATAVF